MMLRMILALGGGGVKLENIVQLAQKAPNTQHKIDIQKEKIVLHIIPSHLFQLPIAHSQWIWINSLETVKLVVTSLKVHNSTYDRLDGRWKIYELFHLFRVLLQFFYDPPKEIDMWQGVCTCLVGVIWEEKERERERERIENRE